MKSKLSIFWMAPILAGTVMNLASCNNDVGFRGRSNEDSKAKANADSQAPQIVADQEFVAAVVMDEALTLHPTFGKVDQQLTLREVPPTVLNLRQESRPIAIDDFLQGYDGAREVETFAVSEIGKIDLLVVVDNSGSMADEQANLAPRLKALTKHLETTDWQIAVVTTDNSCLRGGKTIRKSDPNADTDFESAVMAGINGSQYERGIYQAIQAFQGKCSTGDYSWLRPDSAVAVFFISDEESYCANNRCAVGERPEDLVTLMQGLRPDDRSLLKSYALLWSSSDPNCRRISDESAGTRYEAVVNQIGGLSASICQSDYTATLERISRDVSRVYRRSFDLKFPPDVATINVLIDDKLYADFEIVGNRIKMNQISGSELKLMVSYLHGSMPKFDRFKLLQVADGKTLEAFFDGVKVDSNRLSYDDTTQEAVFADLPPDRVKVRIKYRKDLPLSQHFDVSSVTDMLGDPIAVTIDGKAASGWSYDATTSTVDFEDPPADGADIKVSYRSVDGRITTYDVSYDASVLRNYEVFDVGTQQPIVAKLEGNKLVLSEGDVVAGRKIVVRYDYQDKSDVLSHELAHDPLSGTMSVTMEDGTLGCIQDVLLEGRKLNFRCDADALNGVKIAYRYVAERFETFTVLSEIDANDPNLVWLVLVDGTPIEGWVREARTIRVPMDKLTLDSKVRVIVSRLVKN